MLLVERMVRGAREFMVGMKRDPSYGPVVVFGVGGIFAEAHRDIALGVTPLEDRDIEGMLEGIRASALLDDFRGMPPVDRASLAGAIRALARIAEDHPGRDRDRREPPHRRRRDAGGRRRTRDPRSRLQSRARQPLSPVSPRPRI